MVVKCGREPAEGGLDSRARGALAAQNPAAARARRRGKRTQPEVLDQEEQARAGPWQAERRDLHVALAQEPTELAVDVAQCRDARDLVELERHELTGRSPA